MTASEWRILDLCVHGRVQGVCFRESTRSRAEQLGVRGWVRNEVDGTVRIHAEGDRDAVELLVAWCRQGPPLARVDRVDLSTAEGAGEAATSSASSDGGRGGFVVRR